MQRKKTETGFVERVGGLPLLLAKLFFIAKFRRFKIKFYHWVQQGKSGLSVWHPFQIPLLSVRWTCCAMGSHFKRPCKSYKDNWNYIGNRIRMAVLIWERRGLSVWHLQFQFQTARSLWLFLARAWVSNHDDDAHMPPRACMCCCALCVRPCAQTKTTIQFKLCKKEPIQRTRFPRCLCDFQTLIHECSFLNVAFYFLWRYCFPCPWISISPRSCVA